MSDVLQIDSFEGVVTNLVFPDGSGIRPAHQGYTNSAGVYFDSMVKDGPEFVAAFQVKRGCTTWIEARRIDLKERGFVVGKSFDCKSVGTNPSDEKLEQAAADSVIYHLELMKREE